MDAKDEVGEKNDVEFDLGEADGHHSQPEPVRREVERSSEKRHRETDEEEEEIPKMYRQMAEEQGEKRIRDPDEDTEEKTRSKRRTEREEYEADME